MCMLLAACIRNDFVIRNVQLFLSDDYSLQIVYIDRHDKQSRKCFLMLFFFFFEQLDLCCVYKISGQSQYSQVKFFWFEKKKESGCFFGSIRRYNSSD